MTNRSSRAGVLIIPTAIAVALAVGAVLVGRTSAGGLAPVNLGTAAPFAVLAGTPAITNSGPTIITNDMGIHPAAAVTGFPPGIVNGTTHLADGVAQQAKSDLVIAYDDAASRTLATTVTGGLLGGQTLVAGVYNSGGVTLDLTGTLTLDGQNDPNSVWIFQATSDLITASSSSVAFVNGGSPCNVFWQVTSSATLGSDSTFVGTIMALTSITMNSNVNVSGRALARNGTVTLLNNRISSAMCSAAGPTPAPTTTPLVPNTALTNGGTVVPWPILFVLGALALAGILASLLRPAARKL